MSLSKPLTSALSKVSVYGVGQHDVLLNPLAFGLKLLGQLLKDGKTNDTSALGLGLGQLGEAIDLARYPLRFLLGIQNLNAILTHHDFIASQGGSGSLSDKIASSSWLDIFKYYRGKDWLVLVQRLLNILYNYAELRFYVWMIAPKIVNYNGGMYALLSCRLWFINVALGLLQTLRAHFFNRPSQPITQDVALRTTGSICDLFLALNWSVPPDSYFLSPKTIALLGFISGLIGLRRSWVTLREGD